MSKLLSPSEGDLTLSSTGKGLSLTVKGILINLIPLVIFFGQVIGIEFTQAELMIVIENITQLIAAIVIAIGLFRKLYYWIKSIRRKG